MLNTTDTLYTTATNRNASGRTTSLPAAGVEGAKGGTTAALERRRSGAALLWGDEH